MKSLAIDIETYSSVDLTQAGVYKYCEAEDFQILLFAVSVDDCPAEIFDLAHGESLPQEILLALEDSSVIKWSFNSAFERVCLSRYLGYPAGMYISPEQFRCSMTWCGYLSLPMSLKDAAAVLKLEAQKMDEGRILIRRFCTPPYELPPADDEAWQLFKSYCIRDVQVENEIRQKLGRWPVPDMVWKEFWQSENINDRGIAVNQSLVRNAVRISEQINGGLLQEMAGLTGLENPNSVLQLKSWLLQQGISCNALGRDEVKKILERLPPSSACVRRVLELRLQTARSSVKKYERMRDAVCSDGRLRGMFRFYGANRTGRFTSRTVQLQNLPKNRMPDLDEARKLCFAGDTEGLKERYSDVPDVLSQLIRTAFTGKLLIADESAIEARILSAVSGEKWRIEAFLAGKDIYCESASQMFHVPVVKNGINGELRVKGKIAELALGYGGGVGALTRMGALEMGLSEEELPGIVQAWRAANPGIVKFWSDIGEAAVNAVTFRTSVSSHGFQFIWEPGFLFIRLLSGRKLAYCAPRIGVSAYGGDCLTYMGAGEGSKWCRQETYGAKLTENIIQATARDVLCYALGNLQQHRVVAHVHDEIIAEDDGSLSLSQLCAVMGQSPPWAEFLNLKAEGFESDYYRKD